MTSTAPAESRFAIFLPVRNGAAYIREAIDSVVGQTRSDWTLFILDNASEDATVDIVNSRPHPAIRLVRSGIALSIWQSWHRVWQMLGDGRVQASFVTVIGHDDRLHPTFLEAIEGLVAEYPEATLYQTGFDMIDQHGGLLRPCKPIPSRETAADFLAARMWGLRDSYGTGYVFRPDDYIAVGGIPDLPRLMYSDDLLFARLAGRGFKAATRDSYCDYRLHDSSASNSMSVLRIAEQMSAIEQFIGYLNSEFPEVATGRTGHAMLACLLARDVLVLEPFVGTPLLPAQTSQAIARLAELYRTASRGLPYHRWLGSNFVSRRLYVWSKQAMLFSILLRDRLKRSAK